MNASKTIKKCNQNFLIDKGQTYRGICNRIWIQAISLHLMEHFEAALKFSTFNHATKNRITDRNIIPHPLIFNAIIYFQNPYQIKALSHKL